MEPRSQMEGAQGPNEAVRRKTGKVRVLWIGLKAVLRGKGAASKPKGKGLLGWLDVDAGTLFVLGLVGCAIWATAWASTVVGGFFARGLVSGLPKTVSVALVPVDADFVRGPGAERLEARLASARERGAKVAAVLLSDGPEMFPKSRLEAAALRSFARGKAGLAPDPDDERWLAGFGSASKAFEAAPKIEASRLEIASAFAPFGWLREPPRAELAESDFDEEAKDIWSAGVGAGGFGALLCAGLLISLAWSKAAAATERMEEAAAEDLKAFEAERAAKEIEACCGSAAKSEPKRL